MDPRRIDCDVLVVGGGIAGLMAAMNAAEHGARVIVAEKAHARRSGSGATGNDHFLCYIPEVHGDDMSVIVREVLDSMIGGFHDTPLTVKFLEQSFDRAKDWDQWGINMRPTGTWAFIGHAFPGRPRIWLKYAGSDQKEVLTKQASKRGVRTINFLPITDVIVEDGEVVGAIGIHVRKEEPELTLIRAKSVVLGTGTANRLYPAASPGFMFNTAFCSACTGAAQAMAYRAGAKLVNMEFPNMHAGPKYFARAGKATWIGVVTDPGGRPVGPFVEKPTKELGDITADVWNSLFADMHKSGRGPAYMDCRETAESDLEYMMWGMKEEGNTALIEYMEAANIDLRKNRVEFMQYTPHLIGRGVEIDLNGESSIKGLYAAGDPVGNFRADIAGAAVWGWIAGGNAAIRARKVRSVGNAEDSPLVAERTRQFSEILSRKNGATWQEANFALQQIMSDYAGMDVRSETLLKAGLKYLRDLRRNALDTLRADNAHTLMRAVETLDLIDCGEAIFITALERRETRGPHTRSDFPFSNPLLGNKFLTVRKENGGAITEWRDKLK